MAPALIVNADDYALTPGVSAGIRAAHRDGIVTSTTVLMVAPSARAELRKARAECPDLDIGVHLVLSGGWRPVLGGAVATLCTRRGRLPSSADLRTILRRADPAEVREEWRAQIEAAIAADIEPDHLDCHHHVAYRSERLLMVLLELAQDYALPIRLPLRGPTERAEEDDAPLLFDERLRELASSHGVTHPDRLVDGFGGGATRETLIDLLAGLRPGELAELMCHPGRPDWRLRARSSYTGERAEELALLTDPAVQRAITDRNIRLTTFARA